jgi:hypothetical protein
MDPLSEYLARATIEARLASARERRHGRELEKERRARRPRRRPLTFLRGWWPSRAALVRQVATRRPTPPPPPPTPPPSPSLQLAHALEEAAHRIAEQGTSTERRLLEAMSEVVAVSAPGVAAALVDQGGSEVSRLRAFGLAHTHLVVALGPAEHAWLLDLLDHPGDLERPSRVA